jgi:hypothetical protein
VKTESTWDKAEPHAFHFLQNFPLTFALFSFIVISGLHSAEKLQQTEEDSAQSGRVWN